MLFFTIIKSAIKSLWANKLRSLLAMLGIIIGVGAVIAMIALGTGVQAKVTQQFEALGTNLLIVRPAQRGSGGVMSGTQQNLTVEDALALTALPGVESVSPEATTNSQVKYLNRNTRTQVKGVAVTYFDIQNFEIDKGRFFTEVEASRNSKVVVLGANAATTLFGTDDPLGDTIKVGRLNFLVVGVLKAKGDAAGFNADDQIFVPYSTCMSLILGVEYLGAVDVLVAKGGDIGAVSGQPAGTGFGQPGGGRGGGGGGPGGGFGGGGGTVHTTQPPDDSITAILRKRHRLVDLSYPDDFMIQNRADALARMTQGVMAIRFLLGGIAAISLLVGGIGIMNIMLVTVTERTREIGTRKAIGAKNRDVLLQFLVEAVTMSGLGGALGTLSGILLAWSIPHIPMLTDFPTPVVEVWVILLSVIVSGSVGIFFGLYPAYRASRLDPIDALRYE